MSHANLIEQLAQHKTLGAAPREELAWLAAHGVIRHLAAGDVLTPKGTTVEGMYIVLTGHIAIHVDRGQGRQRVMEWRAGEVTGLLPYSRMSSPPGDNVAEDPTTVLTVQRDLLHEMIRECHQVTSILVHKMVDRARVFTSNDLREDKMASLGKLAAGLAHELNNPAAAIERSAALLDNRLEDAEHATRILGASRLTDAQLAAIDVVRSSCLSSSAMGILSPLERADREDVIADWLAAHAIDGTLAPLLSDTAVTVAALDRIADAVSGPALAAVLRWVASGCSVRQLASEIQDAATRISGLVQAVKGFTYMDQATVAEPVDLVFNLGNTVTVLKSKAHRKSVTVTIAVEPDLPRARGFVGELNQIWSNLIDNALDAAPEGGTVDITARRERSHVVVRVIDNGPGIAPEVRARMFEPFFTTKPVGQGTGLGLDIVRRLLTHNDAEIDVQSTPGQTEFRVTLPVADAALAGSAL